jgi:hypothetical protein
MQAGDHDHGGDGDARQRGDIAQLLAVCIFIYE